MGLLNIIYEDDSIVAVDKPDGVLVHKSRISRDHVFLLQLVRDQIGQFVFPVHRLDRPTSGVILFAKSSEYANHLVQQFTNREIKKKYIAVVRGELIDDFVVDYALAEDDEEKKDAVTEFKVLKSSHFEYQINEYPIVKYSIVEAFPKTGRMHQIRKHLKHVHHPIIGDTKYGDGKHNRAFREKFNIRRLLLHALEISFRSPMTNEIMILTAPLPIEFSLLNEKR
ncbi:MAG: pseudouridine synthase [Kiritimatiellae bacterium]|jgi:tRNA pseudouridine65 synthase|nr:pseudouridine synthase [Kiritimatiellia bacterium]